MVAPAWLRDQHIYLFGAVIYGLVFVVSTVSYFLHQRCRLRFKSGIQNFFYISLSLFTSSRVIWCVLKYLSKGDETPEFIMNRVSFLLFLTTFSLIVVYWAVNYNKQIDVDTSYIKARLKWVFILLNVTLYIVQNAILVAYLIKEKGKTHNREKNHLYEDSIIVLIVSLFLIDLAFLIYGVLFLVSTWNTLRYNSNNRWRYVKKIVIVTSVYTIFFALRVAMFLYRPITNKKVNNIEWVLLAYILPEVIPSVMQLYIMRPKWVKERYPATLNDDDDSDIEESVHLTAEDHQYLEGQVSHNGYLQSRY